MDLVDFVTLIVDRRKRGATTVKIYCKDCGGLINDMGIAWAIDNLGYSIKWGCSCVHCNHKMINWNVTVRTVDLFDKDV
jgi:hypothetical protein